MITTLCFECMIHNLMMFHDFLIFGRQKLYVVKDAPSACYVHIFANISILNLL